MNNKGLSYVEMLLVIAVITIMVSFSALSISLVNRNNVEKISDKLISNINLARTSALTKGTDNGYLIIYNTGENVYCHIGDYISSSSLDVNDTSQNWNFICTDSVEIYAGASKIDSGEMFEIHFRQSTGGLVDKSQSPIIMIKRDSNQVSYKINGVTGKIERL